MPANEESAAAGARRPSWKLPAGVALLVLAAMLGASFANRAPDLRGMPTGTLVERIGKGMAGSAGRIGIAEQDELHSRPTAAVVDELIDLLRHGSGVQQSAAASLLEPYLQSADEPLSGAKHAEVEAALLDRLAHGGDSARGRSLMTLLSAWGDEPPPTLPETMTTAIRELLRAPDVDRRIEAAFAAIRLGPGVAASTADLIEALRDEADGSVRNFLVAALGSAPFAQDEAVQRAAAAALLPVLDDPDPMVCEAAITSLGRLQAAASTSIGPLRARLGAPGTPASIRRPVVLALADLVSSAADADAVLPLVIGARRDFLEGGENEWLIAAGQLAAVASSDGDACRRTRALLDQAQQSGDADTAFAAAVARGRLACGVRDADLALDCLARLREVLPERLAELTADPEFWVMDPTHLRVFESLVRLASWPDLGWNGDELRAALLTLTGHGRWWERAWARRQLEFLPR
ncbi:MAG: HEAT repeat domain-containing protein [Planctomycetota bacterium]